MNKGLDKRKKTKFDSIKVESTNISQIVSDELIVFKNQRVKILDVIYTKNESLQSWLGNIQTCGVTLALAYMLCYLTIVWLQLQMKERSLRWK